MSESIPDFNSLPSTPTSSDQTGVPSPTIQPISGNPQASDLLDPAVLKRLSSKKDGRPRKADLADVRAAQMELDSIEVPDEEMDGAGRIPKLDLSDGRAAVEAQLKKELGRRVQVKGAARIPGKHVTETKFSRLMRKTVNLAMAGDRDMIKLIFLYLGGRPALASKEDKPSTVQITNSIPTPVEKSDG